MLEGTAKPALSRRPTCRWTVEADLRRGARTWLTPWRLGGYLVLVAEYWGSPVWSWGSAAKKVFFRVSGSVPELSAFWPVLTDDSGRPELAGSGNGIGVFNPSLQVHPSDSLRDDSVSPSRRLGGGDRTVGFHELTGFRRQDQTNLDVEELLLKFRVGGNLRSG